MLRIFLYSLIIIGCFANFARNDWGFAVRGYAELILGITFIADLIYNIRKKNMNLTKGNRILSQAERIFVFFFFLANFFKAMHWPGAGPMFVFSSGFIIISALIRLLGVFFTKGTGLKGNLVICIFFLAVISMIAGSTFKTMHWPYGSLLIFIGLTLFIIVTISGILLHNTKIQSLNIRQFISKKYAVSHFVFFYFGVWVVYIFLAQAHWAPRFYTAQNPYVYEKLLEESKKDEAEQIHSAYSELIATIDSKQQESKK